MQHQLCGKLTLRPPGAVVGVTSRCLNAQCCSIDYPVRGGDVNMVSPLTSSNAIPSTSHASTYFTIPSPQPHPLYAPRPKIIPITDPTSVMDFLIPDELGELSTFPFAQCSIHGFSCSVCIPAANLNWNSLDQSSGCWHLAIYFSPLLALLDSSPKQCGCS